MNHTKWTGSYKYTKDKLQKLTRSDQTDFEIEIISSKGNSFVGKVVDKSPTGATAGVGEITGNVSGNGIEFVKKMPVMALIKGNELVHMQHKRHRDIFYVGIISADGKSMSGEWKFKFGFGLLGILPVMFLPTSGTWKMTAIEEVG